MNPISVPYLFRCENDSFDHRRFLPATTRVPIWRIGNINGPTILFGEGSFYIGNFYVPIPDSTQLFREVSHLDGQPSPESNRQVIIARYIDVEICKFHLPRRR